MIAAEDGNGKTVRIEHLEQGLGEIKELLRDHTREEKQAWQKWWDRLDDYVRTTEQRLAAADVQLAKTAGFAEVRLTAIEVHARDTDETVDELKRGQEKLGKRLSTTTQVGGGLLAIITTAAAAIAKILTGGSQ